MAASVVLVEGISDRIALAAAARKLGRDLVGVEIVPIGGAHAVRRAAAQYVEPVVGLCDENEAGLFRRALGDDATYVCVRDLESELIRALGAERALAVLEAEGELETFRHFQNQPAWRGRPLDRQLHRWLRSVSSRGDRYPPLLVAALDPDEIPAPLAGVLAAAV